jgi:hypothetical protein
VTAHRVASSAVAQPKGIHFMSSLLQAYAAFNLGGWPAWVFWYGLAVVALVLVLLRNRLASRFASGFLAAYSIWIGVVFF